MRAKKKNAQVIGSIRVSTIWYFLKCLFPIPCWLTRTRAIASSRSSFLSHRAFSWLSGTTQRKISPSATVRKPVTRKTIFQGSIAEPWRRVPTAMPYATRPPKIWPQPLKLNQMLTRLLCSDLVYHCGGL